jgi:mono/diheme cytochrome c family protein
MVLGLGSLLAACSYTNAYEAPAPCNLPTTVSYQMHVLPILTKNCYSCHSAQNYKSQNSLFNMESRAEMLYYTNPANGINNVSFMVGNIRHDSGGFQPMPKDNDKLSECDIALIKAWVDAGAPNN